MDVILGMPVHTAVLRAAALCYYMVFGRLGDVVILAAWLLWVRGSLIFKFLQSHDSELFVRAVALTTAVFTSWKYMQHRSQTVELSTWNGPGRPLLFPCQTTHTRFFPKKHSFAYSYLMVGIPVDWTGVAGGMISNEYDTGAKGWYNIDAADYLERGNGHLGLRGKLDAYLESQVRLYLAGF